MRAEIKSIPSPDVDDIENPPFEGKTSTCSLR